MNPTRTENAKQFNTIGGLEAQPKTSRNKQPMFSQRNGQMANANMNRSRQNFQYKTNQSPTRGRGPTAQDLNENMQIQKKNMKQQRF